MQSTDTGIIARNMHEEMLAIGQLMTKHMDTAHNTTLQQEIRAIPMYNGFNVMKYFEELVPEGRPLIKTNIQGQNLEVASEFNTQKEYMRDQLSEQIMQCAPLEEDDEEFEDEDSSEEDEEGEREDDEPDFEDATEMEPCTECGCNPCDCDEDEDGELDTEDDELDDEDGEEED